MQIFTQSPNYRTVQYYNTSSGMETLKKVGRGCTGVFAPAPNCEKLAVIQRSDIDEKLKGHLTTSCHRQPI